MRTIVPEIDEIVNFYSSEIVAEIARETGFVQRESKLIGVEFLKNILSKALEPSVSSLVDESVPKILVIGT